MTNHKKPDPTKEAIQKMVVRNDLSEMMECHVRYGVGSPSQVNLTWHIKCWIQSNIDSTTSNTHTAWWCKRIMLLDAILKNKDFHKSPVIVNTTINLPSIHQQLLEVA